MDAKERNQAVFARFGIQPTTDAAVIEAAIALKARELRRAIARGEVDPVRATAGFNQISRQLRAMAAAEHSALTVAPPTKSSPGPNETHPAKAAPPQPPRPTTGACRSCGGLVSLTAEMCPHCGERRPAKKQSQGNAVGVLFALVGGTVALIVLLGSLPGTTTRSSEPNAYYLHSLCEDEVRARLKSPGSAVFNRGSSSTYSASGTVDSQNSFGAVLRSSYQCSFTGESVTSVTVF